MTSGKTKVLGAVRPRAYRLQRAIGLLVVLALTPILVLTPSAPRALAAGETLAMPSATRIVPSTTNAALSDDFNIAGYLAGDTLLTNISLSGPSGTTFSIPTTTGLTLGYGYSSWTGRTDLAFTGTQANINTALDSMTVTTGATSGTAILTVSTTLSTANTYYYAATGHFYQAVSSSGSTWTSANTAASAATYKGRTGYLVTITSQGEQDFLNNNVSGSNIWIGLTDQACEGTWKWQGGPEAGQTAFQATNFGSCTNTSSYSSAGTSSLYTNWCSGEPNNADGSLGEDMAVTKWGTGTCWNDLRDGNSSGVSGYVVEYGDSQAFTDFLSGNMTIAVSTTPGTVASVTSDKLNGTYDKGTAIDIKVNFTDPVNVTGSPTLTLNAAGTQDAGAVATYLSGSGTSTLVFRYTVLEGNSSSDLNYLSTSSLALNGGTITLVTGGTNATLTLPATSDAYSLGGSKSLVITTTTDAPSSSVTAASLAAYATSATVSVPYTASDPSTTIRSVAAYYSTSSSLTSPQLCGTTTSATSPNTITCTLPATNTTYYLYTRATDAAGTQEAAPVSADDSIILDNVAPSVTFSNTPAPNASTGASTTITFTVSESVTTFTTSDVTATYGTLSGFSGSGTTYTATFAPSRSAGGPAVITIAAGNITDAAGNANTTTTYSISITTTNSRTTYTGNGTNGTNGTKYIVERFTSSGTWTAPAGVTSIDALVVGGGGGGGSRHGGGGGAGGMLEASGFSITPSSASSTVNYTVTVGAGGPGAGTGGGAGTAGGSSSFSLGGSSVVANGGGPGSSNVAGGSSGGTDYSGRTVGAATPGSVNGVALSSGATSNGVTAYGNQGGQGLQPTTGCGDGDDWCGGGGGGAGGNGTNGGTSTGSTGGTGGSGRSSTITGSSATYAAGGGGAGGNSTANPCSATAGSAGGLGGSGIGGNGGSTSGGTPTAGTNGAVNTGSGGGGGGYCDYPNTQAAGGSGGSGIVIIRYALPSAGTPDLSAGSDSGSSSTDDITKNTALSFTGSAPVGSSVQLYDGASATGSPCVTNDTTGIWSCTTSTLSAGAHTISAVSTTQLETSSVSSTSTTMSITIDTTLPTITAFTSSTADGTYKAAQTVNITATVSETIQAGASITVTLNSGGTATLTASSQGTTLTGAYTIAASQNATGLTVSSYTIGTAPTDLAGNAMTSTTVPSTNIATASSINVDTTAPTFSVAATNTAGTQITLTYSETLSSTTALASAFSVNCTSCGTAAISNPVKTVAVSGSTVVLTMTETIFTGQTITLAYTDPTASDDANAIQDTAGNDAASRAAGSVTNNATASIPRAARLIGLGTETVVTLSGLSGSGVRGVTSDGTYVYFRASTDYTRIYRVPISSISTGATATVTPTSWTILASDGVTVTNAGTYEPTNLAYSSGCIFIMSDATTLKCVDTTTRKVSTVTVPPSYPLPTGQTWMYGDLVSFPDGRIGKISAQTLTGGVYVSTLRLYRVTGTGGSVTLAWSEDMSLSDPENFPSDDHGFATDGVYGYRILHQGGYKVWRLQSGATSNIIFNGNGTGTCGGSGTWCSIGTGTTLTNATYIGYDAGSNRYFVGDYGANKFYMTESQNPGVGPGTASVTVSSFTTTQTSPTTNTSFNYTLTFGVGVTGVTASDFTNTGSATCSFAVTAVSTSVYTVTPTCGDGTVRPQFAANGAVLASDGTSTGPAFANASSTTVTVAVPPTVTAFTSSTADGSYKAGATINITATISETIAASQTMTVTLNTGATVTLTAAADGTTLTGTYTVGASQTTSDLTVSSFTVGTVADLTGNAMVSTTLPSGANIADTSNIAIDTTVPTVASFTSAQSTPTNSTSFTYTITFSEAVTGVTAADFSNTGTALNCAFAPGADTSSTIRTITITGCSDGTVIPRFALGGAIDSAGNAGPATASTSGTTITLDTVAPTISSFSTSTANGSYKVAQTINITATTNESVRIGNTVTVTLDTGATVTLTAAAAGTTLTGTYTIASGENSADLTVSSFTIGTVLDTAGNAMTSTTVPSGTSNIAGSYAIVVDTTAPTVSSFTSANSTPTTATSFTFTLTFSEAVTGVAAADFSNAGTATGCVFAPGTDSGSTRTVTITACSAGTITPVFAANGANDAAANAGPTTAATASTTINRDTTAPTVVSFSSTTSNGTYTTGGTINITATVSESIRANATITVTLDSAAGATVALTNASVGTTLTGTYTVASGHNSADLTVSSFVLTSAPIDIAGNTMTTTTVPTGANNIAGSSAIVVDALAPSAPSTLDLTTASDTGTSTTDNITGDSTPNINLAGLETGASVVITATSGATTKTCNFTAAAATGNCDLPTLSDGTWVVTAVQTDAAGNASTTSSSLTIYVDATGPAAPTGLSAVASSGAITISFTAGVGGPSAVTNYKYSTDGVTYTALSPAVTSSPITISGLTNETAYSITLKTVTAMGDSGASASVSATPSRVVGLTNINYTEQAAATPISSGVSLSGGTSYDGKYIDFAVTSGTSAETLGYTTSATASTAAGVVSIVGTAVYLGNGTTADPIGSVDATRNGQNGQPLRINFISSFSNAGFESGALSPWTAVNTRIDLGVTQIAGFTSQDTSNYAVITSSCKPSNDNTAPTTLGTLSVATTTSTKSEGSYSLQLSSSGMTTAAGGNVVHGPAVYSDVFEASSGDVIYFDWQAQNGGDYYHVLGYILNTVTGAQTEVLDSWGDVTTWATAQATIPSTGSYRFVFVSGTQDFSCGTAAGASLYIDNVRVYGNKVTDAVASKVARLVTYANSSDAPGATRTVTLTGNPTGGTFTKSFSINITAVDDPPTLGTTSTSYTNLESASETFTPKTGTLSGSDPDGDTLTYALPNGTAGSTTYSSVAYDQYQTGTYGTLWIKASTGQYYYAPDNTAINNRLTNDSDAFAIKVTASGVDATSTFTLSVSITAAGPAAPTGLTVTPGVRAAAVSWTAPLWIGGAAILGYRIEYSTNGSTWTTFSDNTSLATSIRVTGLSDATAYYFRVAAKNSNGVGTYASSSPTTYSTFDKPTSLVLSPAGGTIVSNSLNSTNTNLTAQATIVAGAVTGGTATLYRGSTALATDTSIGASDTTVNFDMGSSTTAGIQGLITTGGSLTVKVVDANGLETLASAAATLTVDYTLPAISVVRSGSGVLNQGASDTITFTLSEPSTNFVSSDVTVVGGTLSALTGSGTSYTGTFTVSANATGAATLSVLSGAFTDAAGNGNSTSSTLSISLNSAPTLATPTTASFVDTIAVDTFTNATGVLVGADSDSGDTLTYGITSGTDAGATVSRTGTYGTLTVTKATGAYTFAPSNSVINARASNATETHTVTVTDGIQTATATFTVSITAANDAPVMAAVTVNFTDTASNDTLTVQTGTFTATDAESNAISSWSMTGASTVADLLAWTSGSITFTRKLVGTYGTLYIESSTGKYRFEPNNAAINGLVSGTSEAFPVTVSDSLSAVGTGSFTASITAVNDRPIATVTVTNIADVTTGLATSAYSMYHSSAGTGSSPSGEQVYRAFDDSSSTKYLNFSGAGSGATIDLGSGNTYAVNGLGLTTANDEPARDPASYSVYGSSDGSTYSLISSGSLTPPSGRQTAYPDVTFTNSTSYRYYRVVFPTIRGGGADSYLQIAEIRLPAKSGQELSYTEGAAAGVVLSGIDVTDPDTATLTGATVSITAGFTSGDILGFVNDGSTMGAIAVDSYNSATGVLTLTGNATPAQYQSAFRAVTFRSTSNNPTVTSTSRTVTWQVNDGQALNNLSTNVTSTITITETVPSISSISVSSSAGSDNRYAIGDAIDVSVTFTEAVTVTGSPRISVNGLSSKYFTYASGSGTSTLLFSYTVASGDSAASGVGIAANALSLNGGTIKDSASANVTITHTAVALSSAHIVDGVLPTITAFASSSADGSYNAGTTVSISATASETVQANGSIDVTLDTGAVVTLTKSSSGTTLTGTYTVGASENSSDLTVASFSITAVLDVAGNAMASTAVPAGSSNIAGAKAIVIDTVAPTISRMAVSADGSYKAGQSLTITATTTENVRSGNTITVTFDTGETLTLTAASAGTTLTGTYTVTAGKNSTDLTVASFSVGTVLDTAGNAMTSTSLPTGSNAIGPGTAVIIDTTAPTVVSFTTGTSNGAYKAGQTINITATISEPVQSGNSITATLNSGATVTLSAPADNQSWSATFGATTCGPYTRRTVTGSLTGGTVWGSGPYTDDSNFNRAAVHAGLVAVGQTAVIEPYNIVRISSYTGSTQNGVTTTGYSNAWCGYSIRLATGGVAASTTLTGTYTIAAGNTASALNVSSFTIGTVADGAGNAMVSTTVPAGSNIGDTSSVAVDTTAPTIASFSSSTADGAYKAGQSVNITATATEAVRAGNSITATLSTGRTVVLTAAAAGTTFSGTYTVVGGDTSPNLNVSSFSIGTVLDTAGNAMTSTAIPIGINSLAGATTIVVDTTSPTVQSFTSSQTSPTSSTTITYTLTFSEAVTGIGSTDFDNTGSAACTFDPGADGSSTSRTVTANCTTTGTLTPRFFAGEAVDVAGNVGPATNNTSTVSVTINNAPTLTAPSTLTFTDSTGPDTFATVTDTLIGADVDPGDALTYSVSTGVDNGTTVTKAGTYGTLTLNKATGEYTYAPNTAVINARTTNATETFTVSVTDGIQTTAASFNVSIIAVNDLPIIGPSSLNFADTAANDSFTVQMGTFTATDAESNTITAWDATGSTTVSSLLAWTGGSITFDRRFTGTHGTLYIQSTSGKFRFEPSNAAINGLTNAATEYFAITATDSASSIGGGSLAVAMSAVNDNPITSVTIASIADVTDGLPTSAYSLYHSSGGSGSSPGGEEVYRAFDGTSSTKYLNFSGAGSGVTIDLGAGNEYAVTGLGLTTANDSSGRDPASYSLYGSANNSSFTLISSGTLSPPTGRYVDYPAVTFSNASTYRYYRVVFPTVRTSGQLMQIAEIRLPAISGGELNYVERATAGVALTGITVADADTTTLTSATVSITSGLTAGDELAFTNDGSTMGSIIGSYDDTIGTLSLSGSGTPAEYQNAFRAVTFRNSTNNPTNPTLSAPTRTLTWRVNDGQNANNLSGAPTSTVTVVEKYATVSSIAFTSSSGDDSLYAIGDTVSIRAIFSETVSVTGTPRVALGGLSGKYATYVSGSGTTALTFAYTVASGDSAQGGLSLASNALALNGGSINDTANLPATITHSQVSANVAQAVDGVIPALSSLTSALATPTNLTTLTYTLTFSEAVTGVVADDFSNDGTADGCVFDPGVDSGSTRTLTVTSCSGGTVIPVFAGSGAVDNAGNPTAALPIPSTNTIVRRHVRTISFAATSFTKTYGDATFDVSASVSRGAGDGSITYSVSTGPCTIGASSGTVTITGAGTCTISATVGQGTFHMTATSTTDATVTVAKKSLTITASSHAVIYGDAVPAITPSYSDFAYNETSADLTTPPSCTTTYTATSTALIDVPTTCTNATSPNYAFTYVPGVVSIAKQPVAVTFDYATLTQTFTGNPRVVTAGTSVTGRRLVYSFTPLDFDGPTVTLPPTNAGTYSVVATVSEANYSGSAFSTLSVEKAEQTPLRFGNSAAVTYGSKLQLVPIGGSGSGALSYRVRSGRCSVTATGLLSNTAAGSCVVRVTKAASANHVIAVSDDLNVSVAKQDQTLQWVAMLPSSPIAGTSYIPGVRASSDLTATISIKVGENVTCSMKQGVVTFLDKGECTISARQLGNANFNAAAPITQTIFVGSLNQTITFPQPDEHRIGDVAFELGAYSSSGLAVAYEASGTACTVSTNGLVSVVAPGTCDITVTQAGDAVYTAANAVTRTLVVRAGLPGIPHLMSAAPGDGLIVVSYATPPTDGGSPILSYIVVASPADGDPTSKSDCSTTTLSCTVVGLVNGTSYRMKVAAVTEAGVGDFSDESDLVTPFAAPEAVKELVGTRQDEKLIVTWDDPDSLGGGTLVRYDLSIREKGGEYSDPVPVNTASVRGIRPMSLPIGSRNHTFTGLRKGATYELKVVTVTNLSSGATATNTAQAVVQKMNASDAPRNLDIEATSETSAVVTWATPLRDGGAPITSYVATTSSGTCSSTTALALSCAVTGLTPGKNLTVTVKAQTKVGYSDSATATISLPGRPTAPAIASVVRSGTSATVTWTAPSSDGGRAVTSYRINAVSTLDSKDSVLCSSTTLTCTVQGLAMSSAYNFTARAFNSVGESATSSTYFSQAFSAVPSAWGSTSAKPGERILAGIPPAPGKVKVLASGMKSNVVATAPKTSVPITNAIITVANTSGRVVLRLKVSIDKSNPEMSVTVPYASSRIRVGVQFANEFGVSPLATTGWKPANYVTRASDSAANVLRGVTAVKFGPVGKVVGQPVYFVGASNQLSAAGKRSLDAIAAQVKIDGGIVNVTGYARQSFDTSAAFIKQVSEQRALVVANYLASRGVQQWIRYQGVGAPTTTAGSDTDRRVVVSLSPYGD